MKRVLLVLLSATLLALGCGDDDSSTGGSGGKSDGGTPASKPATTKMITAKDGGKVESSGALLSIPAGALSKDTKITLGTIAAADLPDSKNLGSKGYDFGPDGTKFNKPVTLTIDFTSKAPAGKSAVMAWLNGSKWTQLADSAVSGGKVTASTTHFTTFAIVFVSNGDGGGSQTAGSCADQYDTSCGGDVVGSWDFSAACVTLGPGVFGKADGGDPFGGCMGVVVSANADFSGTIMFNKDGTYSNDLTSSVSVELSIPNSCLMGLACTDAFDGGVSSGDACKSQMMQAPSTKMESGTYKVAGNMLTTIKDDGTAGDPAEFCVNGNTITAKINSTSDGSTIVFQATRK